MFSQVFHHHVSIFRSTDHLTVNYLLHKKVIDNSRYLSNAKVIEQGNTKSILTMSPAGKGLPPLYDLLGPVQLHLFTGSL